MTNTQHTLGPWATAARITDNEPRHLEQYIYSVPTGERIDIYLSRANASRIVACVNACEGVESDKIRRLIEDGAHFEAFGRELDRVKAINADLLEALEAIQVIAYAQVDGNKGDMRAALMESIKQARAAIAKARGRE